MQISVGVSEPSGIGAAGRSAAFRRYLDLVAVNAVRSLKVRYRGSILGVYWSLSSPLLMTLVYTAIFGTAFSSYYNGSIVQYVLACFTGLAALNFFSAGTSMALPTIVSNGGLLNKIALPPSIFPLATIAANTFQFCLGVLPLLLIVTAVVTHSALHVVALLVPLIGLLMFSVGFALGAAALFVYFRDLPYIFELVVFLLWITSPIFYPAELVPAAARAYFSLNPLALIIVSIRQIALTTAGPSLHDMGAALLAGALSLAVGVLIYRSLRRGFMDLL